MSDIEGAGLISFFRSAFNAVPLRRDFSNSDKALLDQVGNYPISQIFVVRAPIKDYVDKLMGVITLGAWRRTQDKLGVDKVFHTSMRFFIRYPNGSVVPVVFEKNDTPRLYVWNGKPEKDEERKEVPAVYNKRLKIMIDNCIRAMGDNFWTYDSFKNNCVVAVQQMLLSNNLLSASLNNFLKQPIDEFESNLPSYTGTVARVLTDTSRKLRTIVGKGLDVEE